MENYRSTCIKCGKPIPLGANFCQYCSAAQSFESRSTVTMPLEPLDHPYNETIQPNLISSTGLFFKNLTNTSKRLGRADYWWSVGGVSLIGLFIGIFGLFTLGHLPDWTQLSSYSIATWAVLVPPVLLILTLILGLITAEIRRLHDSGRSGKTWLLNLLIPFGGILLAVILCEPSKQRHNPYIP
ncbi:DUF805 domain-containing protein [Levilactobacillus fujinensis]|uniref:DUF805 domain-containing protein n=1 Tax=Levilactobacillus fujinensis TaxID=2486024 RepID=A0ABW1TEQ7_9LACO|nr:DUF805 domain-containing protein [Levilactobacillus fujinensis]